MQQRKPGLSFDWILHYKCNYNCPYCAYSRRRKEQEQLKQQIFVEKLIEAWIKIYEKYSTVYINLNGGEPFIYPSFLELAAELSKKHFINIKTNLSCSMEMLKDFVK
ncbi:MAG: radical SAM protein, partial [Candidatus Omnitrophica bacterium]|nr:radical SAM protein [Candidatus Omnitrophota bacterium]